MIIFKYFFHFKSIIDNNNLNFNQLKHILQDLTNRLQYLVSSHFNLIPCFQQTHNCVKTTHKCCSISM